MPRLSRSLLSGMRFFVHWKESHFGSCESKTICLIAKHEQKEKNKQTLINATRKIIAVC